MRRRKQRAHAATLLNDQRRTSVTGISKVLMPYLAAVTGAEGKDEDAYPDPYLKVELGDTALGSREAHLRNRVQAAFYTRYDP